MSPDLRARLLVTVLGLAIAGCYVGVETPDGATVDPALTSTGEIGSSTEDDESSASASAGTGSGSSTGASTSGSSGDESDSDSDTGVDGTTSGDGTTTTGDESTSSGTSEGTTTTTTTGDGSSSTGSTGSTGGMMGAYCDASDAWAPGHATLEDEVLTIVNQVRSQGASCGSKGSFGPTGPLEMDPLLRCAARYHSKDMVDRDFFSHDNPDGEDPWDRIAKTGYGSYKTAGENIAAGSGTAAGVMNQWMTSDGHCANIMNPEFTEIGIGYYPGGDYGHVWTQVFAAK